MFDELRESISLLFSQRWPTADASITAVDIGAARGVFAVVRYEFSLPDDGPYTGECSSPGWFAVASFENVRKRLAVGQKVPVRYRPDFPSVNKIDRSVWKELNDLEGEL